MSGNVQSFTAHEPRVATRKLRELLERPEPITTPGVVDALGARLVERAGFELCYVTGAGIANTQFAIPDLGLVTLSEMVEQVRRIAAATSLPILVDADTGYGGALSVTRTVQLLEQAGAAGIQLEDQTDPKRCGHFDHKRLLDLGEFVEKIEAAREARRDPNLAIVLRTDAAAVEGLDAAIERAHLFVELGADAVFVEAPTSVEELTRIAREIPNVPLVANMVEGGRTPELSTAQLGEMGYRIVLRANLLQRVMARAATDALAYLQEHGHAEGIVDQVLSWQDRQEIVGLPQFEQFENRLRETALATLQRTEEA